MVEVLFLSNLREVFGQGERLLWSRDVATVGGLRDAFAERGGIWTQLEAAPALRVAVNQVMADFNTPVYDGDEVSFFPPENRAA